MEYIIYDNAGEDFVCHILAHNAFDAALQYCDHYVFLDDGTHEFEVWRDGNQWLVTVKISLNHGINDGLDSVTLIESYSIDLKFVDDNHSEE